MTTSSTTSSTTTPPASKATPDRVRVTPDEGSRERVLREVERFGLLGLTVLVVVVFSTVASSSDVYASKANVDSLLANQAVPAIVALATFIPLICGQFDLSLGAIVGLSSITAATVMSDLGWPVAAAVGVAAATGALVGLVNGVLVAVAKVNSLIATLAMATLIGGVVNALTSGESIVSGIPLGLVTFGSGSFLGVPNAAWMVVVVGAAVAYVVNQTPFGRYVLAVGSNPRAAALAGLDVNRLVVLSFGLAGLVAGLAGALQVARGGGANPSIGPGFALPAFAAVFLGATAIRPGRNTVMGTLLAVAFLALLTSGLTLSGVPDYVNDIVVAVALVAGVALSTLIARKRAT